MESMERSVADFAQERKKHKTGRERFLEKMEELMPWEKRVGAITY